MTSKLIDKLTKFCFHSASPTTPASHTHNPSKPNPQHLLASPPTPLRMERGVITEIDLSLGITKPNSIAFTTKFCLYFTPSLYLSLCHSVSKKNSVFLCPYVILSLKKHSVFLCPYVILSLKKLCHYMSLCHSVSKKHSVIICLYVILSLKKICLYSSLCYSVSKKHSVIICLYVILSLKKICLYSSLCYSVSKKTLCHYMSLCHSVSKKTMSLLVPMLFCL